MNRQTIISVVVLIAVAGVMWFFSYRGNSIEITQVQVEDTQIEKSEPEQSEIASIEIIETDKEAAPITSDATSTSQAEYKKVMTTLFWVGEEADASNAYISNNASAWDSHWVESYGGVDDPDDRCGFEPCKFEPNENPFYFALPYNDIDENGKWKKSAELIPWFEEEKENMSVVKNRWIEVRYAGNTCYAQWEDVGPLEIDDSEYVFGDAEPRNTFGASAGLDVSPAVRNCLGLKTNAQTEWRFVDFEDVPDGPWTDVVTTSDVHR